MDKNFPENIAIFCSQIFEDKGKMQKHVPLSLYPKEQ